MLPKPSHDGNLSHALAYADLGWHVFPLRPQSKAPYPSLGVYAATTDKQQICRWWTDWPNANIGLHCGASGIVAIDEDAADILVNERINLVQQTPTNITANGQHLLYRQPQELEIKNHHRHMPTGVHVRGWGGYIVLPPSVHPSGKVYTWEDGFSPWDLEPASLSPDLLQRLLSPSDTTAARAFGIKGDIPDVEAPELSSLRIPISIRDAIDSPAPRGKRSEQDASVIWHLLFTAGLTPAEVKAIYDTHPIGTRGKYAERGDEYLLRTIKNAYTFGPRQSKTRDGHSDIGRIIEDVRYRVMCHEWAGRRGSNARTLMLAVLTHMKRTGATEVHLSCRQMADLSGFGKDTVRRILSDEMLSPFLVKVRKHNGLLAPVYRLVGQNMCEFETHLVTSGVSMCVSNSHVSSKTRVFESQNHELARQISNLLADDAFVRNHVPTHKRHDVKRIYVKSFTHVGRDVLAYTISLGGRAPLSDVCAFIGTSRPAVTSSVQRMSDGLAHVGVDPIAWLETDEQDRRRKVIVVSSEWRSRLNEARSHLYTDGTIESRRQSYAIERYWRALKIADITRDEDHKADAHRIAVGAAKVYERTSGQRLSAHPTTINVAKGGAA